VLALISRKNNTKEIKIKKLVAGSHKDLRSSLIKTVALREAGHSSVVERRLSVCGEMTTAFSRRDIDPWNGLDR
jgi:hypothetical protein